MSKKKSKFRERVIEPVDVRDDAMMVGLGLRPPMYGGRDADVWSHSRKEKRMLRGLRASSKKMRVGGIAPVKRVPVKSRLIVYLGKRGTHSCVCWQHEIDQILSYYGEPVVRYSFNGKYYGPSERPFWYS